MDREDPELNTRNSTSANMSGMTSGSETTTAEKANVEDLRKQIRALTNECNGLREILPRVKDKKGEDVVREMAKLGDELSQSRKQTEKWENNYAKLNQDYDRAKRRMMAEIKDREEQIRDMKKRAAETESEYQALKKQMDDEESRRFGLQPMAREAETSADSAGFPDLSKTNASRLTGDRSLNDLEYVIGQMMGVLMQLEINSDDTEDLRKKIVHFLRHHGHHVNLQNVITLTKEFEEKLNAGEIRATNRELGRQYGEGNLELQVRVQELSQDVSVTYSELSRPMLSSRAPTEQVMGRMRVLRGVCNQLFVKLQGTAQFLQTVLENLGDSEEARELITKISEIHLDLNKSMGEAQMLADEIHMTSCADESAEAGDDGGKDADSHADKIAELMQEVEALRTVQRQYQAMKASLHGEIAMKEELKSKLEEFEHAANEMQLAAGRERDVRKSLDIQIAGLQKLVEQFERGKTSAEERLRQAQTELATKETKLKEWGREKTVLEEKLLKYQSSVEANAKALADSNKQREVLQKRLRDLETSLGRQNAQLIDSDKAKCDVERELEHLRQLLAGKEREIEEANRRAKQSTEIIRKNNKQLYERIKTGMKDMNKSVVIGDPATLDEQLSNVQKLNDFLEDCQLRANNVIQCLKAASQVTAMDERGVEIPDLDAMLDESRSLRFMLYRLRLFFINHKENLAGDKKFNAGIIAELRGIYNTLQEASKSSQVIAQSKKSQSHSSGQK